MLGLSVVVLFTMVLFAPLFSGRTFSIIGAYMQVVYPWASIAPTDDRDVRGRYHSQSDQAEETYPLSVALTRAVRGGELPIWLPDSRGGLPLLGQPNYGLFYPPRLLAMLALSPIEQQNALVVSHVLLAGLAMYALLRCWGAHVVGAVLGAMVWGANGQQMFWLVLTHVVTVEPWLPLALLGSTLAVRRRSNGWAAMAGASLGMAILTGALYQVYLSALLLTGWYGALALRHVYPSLRRGDRSAAIRTVLLPGISMLVALGLGALQWAPLIDVVPRGNRQPLSLEFQAARLPPPSEILTGFVMPHNPELSGSAGTPFNATAMGFVGIPTLLFASVSFHRYAGPTIFAGIVVAVSLACVLGVLPLLRVLYAVLPWLGLLRLDTFFLPLDFGLAILAGLGLTELSRRLGSAQRSFWLVLGLAALAIQGWQLVAFAWEINPIQPNRPEWLFPETPLTRAVLDAQGDSRVMSLRTHVPGDAWSPPILFARTPLVYGIRSAGGYDSLLPRSSMVLWLTVDRGGRIPSPSTLPVLDYRSDLFHDQVPIELLRKLSVRVLVGLPGVVPTTPNGRDLLADGSLSLLYDGPDGRVFEDRKALPRAYLTPATIAMPDRAAVLRRFVDPSFDPRAAAIVVGDLPTDQAESLGITRGTSSELTGATATIVGDRFTQVEIDATSPRAAVLVLNDSWAPGWRVSVNGERSQVVQVNYDERGVVVPAGSSHVVFQYRPGALPLWIGASGGTAVSLVCYGLYASVRRVRQRSACVPGRKQSCASHPGWAACPNA